MSAEAATTIDALLRQLHWRYACKAFDPTRKIPPATWAALEQSLVLSPSRPARSRAKTRRSTTRSRRP